MPDKTPPADVMAVARELTGALDGLSERLESAMVYGRRNRHMIWGLVVSVILDLALSIGLTIALIQSNHASDQAKAVHRSQYETCQSSNESRALNVQLWEYVLSVQPKQQTDAQEKRIKDFRTFMRKTFAPRDCSQV